MRSENICRGIIGGIVVLALAVPGAYAQDQPSNQTRDRIQAKNGMVSSDTAQKREKVQKAYIHKLQAIENYRYKAQHQPVGRDVPQNSKEKAQGEVAAITAKAKELKDRYQPQADAIKEQAQALKDEITPRVEVLKEKAQSIYDAYADRIDEIKNDTVLQEEIKEKVSVLKEEAEVVKADYEDAIADLRTSVVALQEEIQPKIDALKQEAEALKDTIQDTISNQLDTTLITTIQLPDALGENISDILERLKNKGIIPIIEPPRGAVVPVESID